MRNILIIASLYGSKRVVSLAKYLPEFGWKPTVITPPVSWQPTIISSDYGGDLPFNVVETGYDDRFKLLQQALHVETIEDARVKLKKKFSGHSFPVDWFFRLGGTFLNYPDSFSGWKDYALKAARNCIDEYNIEAIISICPVTSHVVACQINKEYGLPWISDLPDLWSANHNYAYGKVRRWFDRRLERKTMRNVNILTTTSEPRARQIRYIHHDIPVQTITLGYSNVDYDVEPIELTKKFTITYTGVVYEEKQDPSKIVQAVAELIEEGVIDRNDVEIRFYGRFSTGLDVASFKFKMDDVVTQYGSVPHSKAVKVQRESQINLLLDWEDENELGVIPGKLFEYIGARRPILATGGSRNGEVAKIVKYGMFGTHDTNVEFIKGSLKTYYREYKQRGFIYHDVNDAEVSKFNQLNMAKKYADILERITL